MGNHKFKLSDMIPNAWFYKLKDMNKTSRKQNPNKKKQSKPTPSPTQPSFSSPRHSYYFTTDPLKAEKLYSSPLNPKFSDTHFPEPPRKSSYRRSRTKRSTISSKSPSPKLVNSTISNGGGFKSRLGSVWNEPDFTPDLSDSLFESSPDSISYEFMLPNSESDHVVSDDPFDSLTSWSSNCSCRISSSTADIIIDMEGKDSFSSKKFDKLDAFDSIPALELPPILTKPAKFNDMVSEIKKKETECANLRTSAKLEQRKRNDQPLSVKVVKEQKIITSTSARKSSTGSSSLGVKLRSNSPKIANKKIQALHRKSVSSTSSSSKSQKKNINVGDSFAIMKSSFDPQSDFRESMVEMIVENNIRASKDLENLLACYLSLNSNEYHDLIIKVFEQIWFDLTNFRL